MNNRSGFSLLEVLIAVLIVTILATVVGVKLIPRLGQAKVAAARAQLVNFRTGLKLYRMDNGQLPTQEQGLDALCVVPSLAPVPSKYPVGGYLESRLVPFDPWGNEYVYLVPGSYDEPYEIISYGADGEPGGEQEEADISSSDV